MKLLGPGCVLDTDAMCRRNEIVVWLVCRIRGNGSDWKLGLHSTHQSCGGPGCMCCWVVVNECFGPEWGKWYLVEIETAVDFLVG